MKKLFLLTTSIVALAGSVLAQQPPAPPKEPPPPGNAMSSQPRGAPSEMEFEGHKPPPPPPSKAAHFRIDFGETKIDIKCSDDDPTKVCADILLQVLDRINK